MYPQAYIEFLAHFHGTRDYFECHEVLEDYWKATEPKQRDSVWVLLIQIAVSMYHYRRGNNKGAAILMKRSIDRLSSKTEAALNLGIDPVTLTQQLKEEYTRIQSDAPYQSLMLPIKDPELLKLVLQQCEMWKVDFASKSDLTDIYLIEKHKRRIR